MKTNNKYGIISFFIDSSEIICSQRSFTKCFCFSVDADPTDDYDDTPDNQNQIHVSPEIIDLTDQNEHDIDEVKEVTILFVLFIRVLLSYRIRLFRLRKKNGLLDVNKLKTLIWI